MRVISCIGSTVFDIWEPPSAVMYRVDFIFKTAFYALLRGGRLRMKTLSETRILIYILYIEWIVSHVKEEIR